MIRRNIAADTVDGRETWMQNTPDHKLDAQFDDDARRRRQRLMNLLRGRWHWATLLGLVLGIGAGYAAYTSEPDLYQAKSLIEIKSKVVTAEGDAIGVDEEFSNFIQRQVRTIYSEQVVSVAMNDPAWREAISKRPSELPEYDSTRSFSNSLIVREPSSGKNTITVAFVDPDAATAAAGLAAIMGAYDQVYSDVASSESQVDRRSLQEQIQRMTSDRQSIERVLEGVVPRSERLILDQTLSARQSQLNFLERRFDDIQLGLNGRVDAEGNATAQLLEEMVRIDPKMRGYMAEREQLEKLLRHYTEVMVLGENHRDVVATNRQLSLIENDIFNLEQEWAGGDVSFVLPTEINDMVTRRQGLIDQMAGLEAEIADLARDKEEIDRYEEQIATIQGRIDGLEGKVVDIDIRTNDEQIANRSRITLGGNPGTPTRPYNAKTRVQLAGLGGLGGFAIGFGMVIFVGLLDRRMRHVTDATAGELEANVLGILPTLPANMKDPSQGEAAAHCVHHIRTLLQIGGSNRVFSVTSPAAGSGKSSLTCALGLSFAASGTKTLIIDCDLVGAGLSRRLGAVVHQPLDVVIRHHRLLSEESLDQAMTASATQGLPLDVALIETGLMDDHDVEKAVRLQRDTALGTLQACAPGRLMSCVAESEVPNLYVIPVGNATPQDAGKLSPIALRTLIQQAREEFDIVMIDTGPVLGSLEASIAAAEADATVLIVSRGDRKTLVQKSLAQLNSVKANIVGMVFNHALENDMSHTSYASVVSRDRRPTKAQRSRMIASKEEVARLGPLGSAVASFTSEEASGNSSGNGSMNGH